MYETCHYLTTDGRDVFIHWLKAVRDPMAKGQIIRHVNRLERGTFGDHSFCRDGVWELRVHIGTGYRIYYALAGLRVVLLLGGWRQTHPGCRHRPSGAALARLAKKVRR